MAKNVEIIAGSIADELFRNGLANDRNMFSATALVHPQHNNLVVQAHKRYIDAGATLVLTSNACVVPGLGFTTDEIREYTRLAGQLAAEARDRTSGTHGSVQICGSLPPLAPSYRSDRTVERQRGHETYELIAESLAPFVDVFVAEPMSSVAEAKLALGALAAFDKPAMVSFALNSTGELRSGEAIIDSILEVLAFCDERINTASTSSSASGINISSTDNANTVDTDNDNIVSGNTSSANTANIVSDNTANIGRSTADASDAKSRCTLRAILFSCSQAEDIAKALQHVRGAKELALKLAGRGIQLGGFADRISPLSKAGVLEERLVSGVMQSAVDMEVFASFAQRWVDDGATIVGGCCGVPPDYLARIRERAAEQQTVSP